ncbi:recombinase family protein [Fibrella forsythiae]|uniref:Recombinase family protein n=1 Tax=Fibrella forsythiae TaxID=2817061 RepID=A0ABS3JMG0_9BACT|nr:recombinase family protein [Fibrella forsythiae]MBO0951192.1 recombinase family protein [Fibrella forsythiae]
MNIGYARVSTLDQNLDLQLDALAQAGCERIFKEKLSGAKDDRPELTNALAQLRPGDTLIVYKLDRLSRSTIGLLTIIDELRKKDIGFISLDQRIDTTTSIGRMQLGMIAVFAEFEREMIRDRSAAGRKAAAARGQKGGRPAGLSTEAKAKAKTAAILYKSGSLSVKQICEQLNIATQTLYNYLANEGIAVGKAIAATD